jgi:hypothetical protein
VPKLRLVREIHSREIHTLEIEATSPASARRAAILATLALDAIRHAEAQDEPLSARTGPSVCRAVVRVPPGPIVTYRRRAG